MMNECPDCEIGELEVTESYTSVDWVHVEVKCDYCETKFLGDIQVDHLTRLED